MQECLTSLYRTRHDRERPRKCRYLHKCMCLTPTCQILHNRERLKNPYNYVSLCVNDTSYFEIQHKLDSIFSFKNYNIFLLATNNYKTFKNINTMMQYLELFVWNSTGVLRCVFIKHHTKMQEARYHNPNKFTIRYFIWKKFRLKTTIVLKDFYL